MRLRNVQVKAAQKGPSSKMDQQVKALSTEAWELKFNPEDPRKSGRGKLTTRSSPVTITHVPSRHVHACGGVHMRVLTCTHKHTHNNNFKGIHHNR